MMEEQTDDSFDDDGDRPLERWAPLGASNASPPLSHAEFSLVILIFCYVCLTTVISSKWVLHFE
jgi:hypothetical protein